MTPERGASEEERVRTFELVILLSLTWLVLGSVSFSLLITSRMPLPFWSFQLMQGAMATLLVVLATVTRHSFTRRLLLPLSLLFANLCALPLVTGVETNFYGYDTHLNLSSTIQIFNIGWNPGSVSLQAPLQAVYPWPIMDLESIALSMTTGVPFVTIARTFPLIYSTIGLVALYAVTRLVFNERVAIYAVIAVGSAYLWIFTNDLYSRQAIANPIFWTLIYVLFKSSESPAPKLLVLTFLLATAVILAHSLTGLLLVLLFAYFVIARIQRLVLGKIEGTIGWRLGRDIDFEGGLARSALPTALAFTVFVFAYWLYVFSGPLAVAARAVQELSSGYQVSRPLSLPRSIGPRLLLSLAGTFGFILLASSDIVLRSVLDRRFIGIRRSYSFFGIFIFLAGEASTIFRSLYLDTYRFVAFAWAFLIPTVSHRGLPAPGGRRHLRMLVVILFVLFNLAIFPPSALDRTQSPDYGVGEYRGYFFPSEYVAIDFLPPTSAVAGDQGVWHLVSSYHPDSTTTVDVDLFNGNLSHLARYNFVVVRQEDFQLLFSATIPQSATKLTSPTYNRMLNNPQANLIFSSGSTEVFEVSLR